MQHSQNVKQWAQTVELAHPISWGELEKQILALPVPEEEIRAAESLPRGPGDLKVAVSLLLRAPLFLAPFAGLVLVIIALGADEDRARNALLAWASVTFIAAIALVAAQGMIWLSTRLRSAIGLAITAPVTAASLAAYLLVRPLPGASWASLLALVATVLGLVVTALLLFVSKPSAPRVRGKSRALTPHERVQKGFRAQALEEFLKRGAISDTSVDVSGLVDMPLGTWHLVDERRDR